MHVVGAVQALVWLPWLRSPLVASTSLASPREIVATNGNYREPAAREIYVVGLAALFVTVGCVVFAMGSMFVRFRRGDDRVRQQIKLVLYSAAFAIAAMLLDGHLGLPSDVLLPFGLPLIAIAVAVAVTRYRLYDIDRLVSRALSYVLLTSALVALYVVSVALTTRALPFSSSFGVAASTLLAAALFHPLRRRVQRVVDRRFNRSSYISALVVDAFAQDIRQTVDPGAITSELVTVVQRTVQPQSVFLWIMPILVTAREPSSTTTA